MAQAKRWLRVAGLVALVAIVSTGCAINGALSPDNILIPRPQVYVAPPRPAGDLALDSQWYEWIDRLIEAYEKNCIALKVLRGEPEDVCHIQ